MIKVSAVSYLNALPMVYGLQRGPNASLWNVRLELPAQSARSLREQSVDVALMPVGALHAVPHAKVIGKYCVGAEGAVRSVCLFAHRLLSGLRTIYLDPHSRTSAQLVQILAKHHWKKEVRWAALDFKYLEKGLAGDEGVVLIGDKVFSLRERYEECYDLAEEWIAFAGLPFVFAAWVSTQAIAPTLEAALNEDFAWGVAHVEEAVEQRAKREGLPCSKEEAIRYLRENINYEFTEGKRRGMQHYLTLREELALGNPIGSTL